MGFKAEILRNLVKQGLPVLDFSEMQTYNHKLFCSWTKKYPFWSIRGDYPYKKDGLPLFSCQENSGSVKEALETAKKKDPALTFIICDAPDVVSFQFNAVLRADGDILIGDISYDRLTLRSAWVRGTLVNVNIDGTVQDFFLQGIKSYRHVEKLREIRRMLLGTSSYYELTVLGSGRVIFWQEDKNT